MDNIESIPLSSIVAYMLLKTRRVTFLEVYYVISLISKIKNNYYIDDEDFDETLSDCVTMTDGSFAIRDQYNYNSIINGMTLRDYLIMLASKLNIDDLLSKIEIKNMENDSLKKKKIENNHRLFDRRKVRRKNILNRENRWFL